MALIVRPNQIYRPVYSAGGGGGGGFTDGASFTITGTGWGTNSASYNFLGGLNGVIDSGTNGSDFSATGWTPVSGIYVPRWTTAQTLCRSKSLGFDSAYHASEAPSNSGAFGVGYDCGAGFAECYWSSYIYYGVDPSLTASQQKFYRVMPTVDVQDTAPQRYFTHWVSGGVGTNEGDGDAMANPNNIGSSGGSGFAGGQVYLHPTNGPNASRYPNSMPNNNTGQWYHIQVWHKMETSVGAHDGEWKIRVTRVSDGTVMVADADFGIRDYIDAGRVRYWIMQHYFGNASPGVEPGGGYCYDDDGYIQFGSNARKVVFVGDASTWSACTKLAIQPWTSWSNTSITCTGNKGPHASVSGKYAYVMSDFNTPFSTTGIAI